MGTTQEIQEALIENADNLNIDIAAYEKLTENKNFLLFMRYPVMNIVRFQCSKRI